MTTNTPFTIKKTLVRNNDTDIPVELPAWLANATLSFAFQLNGQYVTSNVSGLLTVKTQKDMGRIKTLKTVNLATIDNLTIPGVYSNLFFTFTNAINCDTLVISVDQFPNLIGDIGNSSSDGTYRGTYNADTNTPFLQNGVGQPGDFYICTVAGINNPTQALLQVNEIIMYNGAVWQNVGSINGTDDIAVSDGYVPIPDLDIVVGQSLTVALGALQGWIITLRNQLNAQLIVSEAETDILIGSVVYQVDSTSKIRYAQANGNPQYNAFGIVQKTALTGQTAIVQTYGVFTNSAWNLIPGRNVYLSPDVRGGITSVEPAAGNYLVILGSALTATSIKLEIINLGLKV